MTEGAGCVQEGNFTKSPTGVPQGTVNGFSLQLGLAFSPLPGDLSYSYVEGNNCSLVTETVITRDSIAHEQGSCCYNVTSFAVSIDC